MFESFLKSVLVTTLLQVCLFSNSQVIQKRVLTIGDTLPDVEIKNVLNYKSGSIKTSEFKGKLLILDFWATWCGACIKAFPKLDSLQKIFGSKVQVLAVTYEDSSTVTKFLKRFTKLIGLTRPVVVNDNYLRYRFVHSSLPHYVWIDGNNRRVIAITESYDVNRENISTFLEGKHFEYTLKKDEEKVLVEQPMFPPTIQEIEGSDTALHLLENSELVYRSILTTYVAGLSSGGSNRDSTYIAIRNSSVSNLYKTALFGNSIDVINSSLVQYDIPDLVIYSQIRGVRPDGTKLSSGIETEEWLKVNGYCYESKVPPELARQRYEIMREELNRYFGAKYRIVGVKEKVKRKCLALIRTVTEDRLATKGGDPTVDYDRYHFNMRNMSIKSFYQRLALPLQSYPPIIDETNYSGNIDLEINCNISDINALNKELEKVGLKFVEKDAMLETAVIRMKKEK